MGKFIHIRAAKFPVLPDENEEVVNDGMYGKSLALYLQSALNDRGYDATFVCCEDWGWWVELKSAPFVFGVCVYCGMQEEGHRDFVCTDSVNGPKKWSWRRFRFLDTSPWVDRLHEHLVEIFRADADIEVVTVTDQFPDLDAPAS